MPDNKLKQFFIFLVEIFFPSYCVGCNTNGRILCDFCISNIRRTTRPTSHKILTAFDYRDPVIKRAIWRMKYKRYSHMGIILGEILYETLLEDIADITCLSSQKTIIIPVPISRQKARARGYNQAEMIAKGFVKKGEKEQFELNTDIVLKIKDTLPQARITLRNARLANIKDAFILEKEHILRGRTVFIIDDVTTTGSTLQEIMKLCKTAGAKRVYGFAIAH